MKDFEKLLDIETSNDSKELLEVAFLLISTAPNPPQPLSSILTIIEPRFNKNNYSVNSNDLKNLMEFQKYISKKMNKAITIDRFFNSLNIAKLNDDLRNKKLSTIEKVNLFYHLVTFCCRYYSHLNRKISTLDKEIKEIENNISNTKSSKKRLSYIVGIQDVLDGGIYYLNKKLKYLKLIKNNRGRPVLAYLATNYTINNISGEFKYSHQLIYEMLYSSMVYFNIDKLKGHELNDSETIKKWMQRFIKSNKLKELSKHYFSYEDSEYRVHFIDDEDL